MLPVQRLVRIDQRADGVGRERGLRETGEDQLQLALVVRDVADREDAGMVGLAGGRVHCDVRSEEHTSELQSLMRISYAVFCLKKKINNNTNQHKLTSNRA